jgi:hypothetical protein
MIKSNADYAVECAQQLSQHDPHRSTLIRMSMAIRDLHGDSPQRTWVGLTDEQKSLDGAPVNYGIEEACAWVSGAEWAEAKLKEKNT